MTLSLNLGRVQPKKRPWTTAVDYTILDFVQYNNSMYTCVTDHTSTTANKPGVGTEWELVSGGLNFIGPWQNIDYDYGSTVTYAGNSYVATTQIAQNDGSPDVNTDWLSIAGGIGAYQGDYNAAAAYSPGDFVKYRGSFYRASTGVLIGEKPTAYPAKWETIAFGLNGPNIPDLVAGANASYEKNDIIRFRNSAYVVLDNINSNASDPQSTPSDFELLFDADNFVGTWATNSTYYKNDVVHYGNGLWRCTAYAQNQTNPRAASGYWYALYDTVTNAGAWTNSLNYYVGDIVQINKQGYICIVDHTATQAERPTNATQNSWDVLVAGFDYAGSWVQGSYDIGDVVLYGSTSFVAIRTIDATETDPPPDDATAWEKLADGFGDWQGDWVDGTTYTISQVVMYNGSMYRATTSTTARPNETTTDWEVLARGNSETINDYPDIANGDAGDGTYYVGQLVRWHGGLYRVVANAVDTSTAANNPSDTPAYYTLIAVGYELQGTWSASTTYYPNDLVYSINSAWRCTAKTIPNSDSSPENLPSKWEVYSIGMRYRGNHDGLLSYFPGDVVTYTNSLYLCIATVTTGNPTDTTYWTQMVLGPPIALPFNLLDSNTNNGISLRASDGTTTLLQQTSSGVRLQNTEIGAACTISNDVMKTAVNRVRTVHPLAVTANAGHLSFQGRQGPFTYTNSNETDRGPYPWYHIEFSITKSNNKFVCTVTSIESSGTAAYYSPVTTHNWSSNGSGVYHELLASFGGTFNTHRAKIPVIYTSGSTISTSPSTGQNGVVWMTDITTTGFSLESWSTFYGTPPSTGSLRLLAPNINYWSTNNGQAGARYYPSAAESVFTTVTYCGRGCFIVGLRDNAINNYDYHFSVEPNRYYSSLEPTTTVNFSCFTHAMRSSALPDSTTARWLMIQEKSWNGSTFVHESDFGSVISILAAGG